MRMHQFCVIDALGTACPRRLSEDTGGDQARPTERGCEVSSDGLDRTETAAEDSLDQGLLLHGTPARSWVTPHLRTARRAAWVGDRRPAPSRCSAAVGSPSPGEPTAHQVERGVAA